MLENCKNLVKCHFHVFWCLTLTFSFHCISSFYTNQSSSCWFELKEACSNRNFHWWTYIGASKYNILWQDVLKDSTLGKAFEKFAKPSLLGSCFWERQEIAHSEAILHLGVYKSFFLHGEFFYKKYACPKDGTKERYIRILSALSGLGSSLSSLTFRNE